MIALAAPSAIDQAVADAVSERYAALYVRVSTGKQKDNWSVKDQLTLRRLGEERARTRRHRLVARQRRIQAHTGRADHARHGAGDVSS